MKYKYIILLLAIYILLPELSLLKTFHWLSCNYLVRPIQTGDALADTFYSTNPPRSSKNILRTTATPQTQTTNEEALAAISEEVRVLILDRIKTKFNFSFFYFVAVLFIPFEVFFL